ncbi:hypothetical protein M413DRAFT_435604 [Hebeloma cylindrosporum]|uniref:Ras GEF n=1 Tax=Hebeloma cylindrosporum TaxID=76867 RepID=A0A0C2Y005_HEBCY|nr:hypothetical protein M413DRAFT_435604 [Hebeloma cylindrosporum h7]
MSTPKPLSQNVQGRHITRLPLQPQPRLPSTNKLLSSIALLEKARAVKDPLEFRSVACDYSTAMLAFRNQVPQIAGLDLENTLFLSALIALKRQHLHFMDSFFSMEKEIWDERTDICVQSYKSMHDAFVRLVSLIKLLLKELPALPMPSSKVSASLNQGYVSTISAPTRTICDPLLILGSSSAAGAHLIEKNNSAASDFNFTTSVNLLCSSFGPFNSSSMTLVVDPPSINPFRLSFRNALGPSTPRLMLLNRVSTFIFPVDPTDAESDVEMPLPIDMDLDVTFDTNTGELDSATLRALVCILSSQEGIMHTELIAMVFTCFRYFSTPDAFWLTLVEEYSKQRPDGLNAAQIRVWKNNDLLRRIRVTELLRIWLEQYWSSTHDAELQPRIREFFNYRLRPAAIDNSLKAAICHAIYTVQDRTDNQRFAEKLKRLANRAQFFKNCENYPPTGFKFPFNVRHHYLSTNATVLSSCYTEPGKDELARQLSLLMSTNFRKVIPTDAIEVWLTHDKPKAQRKSVEAVSNLTLFGEMLSMWVVDSIINCSTGSEGRVSMICFWIDVAMLCDRYRNFNGAAYISSAIQNSAVSRMKSTVLAVPKASKLKLHVLEKACRTEYRSRPDTKWLPILPMTAHLTKMLIIPPRTPKPTPMPNHIQLHKYWMFMSIITTLEKSQVPYTFTKYLQFQEWILGQLSRFYHRDATQGEIIYGRFFNDSKAKEPTEERLSSIEISETWGYMACGKTFKRIKFPVEENTK